MRTTILIFTFLLISAKISATIWMPPQIKTYYSENKIFMLKVIPNRSSIDKQDKNRIEKDSCYGEFYKIQDSDTIKIWTKKFLNKTCPVNAIISDNGKYIVTFFDWYDDGENDIVIYNLGDIVKTISKQQILKCFFIDKPVNNWMSNNNIIEDNKISITVQFSASIDFKLVSLSENLIISLENGEIEFNESFERLREKSCEELDEVIK